MGNDLSSLLRKSHHKASGNASSTKTYPLINKDSIKQSYNINASRSASAKTDETKRDSQGFESLEMNASQPQPIHTSFTSIGTDAPVSMASMDASVQTSNLTEYRIIDDPDMESRELCFMEVT